jgi:3-oxoadipate CoA-transferase beta subunit
MRLPADVSRVYTNLAVLDVTEDGFVVRELAPGVDFETVQAKTDARLTDARVLA